MMNRNNLKEYYSERESRFGEIAKMYKKKIFSNSLLRVLVFSLGAFLVYYFSHSTPIILISLLVSISVFLFLVKRQVDLKIAFDHNEALKEINSKENQYLAYDFHDFDPGDDLKVIDHPYCQDIDIYGRGSFFQFVNRTVLPPARKKLGQHLLGNDIDDISSRQRIIKELAEQNDWSQQFLAEAYAIKTDVTESEILVWLKDYKSISTGIFKFLPIIMTIFSLIAFGLLIAGAIPESMVMMVLFIGLFISGIKVKNINEMAGRMAKSHHLFQQYAKLLQRIEDKEFICSLSLKNLSSDKPSLKIKRFSKLLNSLNQRNNILISIFVNGFFLRDIWICSKIDKWISENNQDVEEWFNLLHDYDKYISFGIYAFNHNQEIVYPTLKNEGLIKALELGHPLINHEKRISNDFIIDHNDFNIITGANMAGKSTFLRTIGLSIVKANSGLPIIAKSFDYRPIMLISSMRTSDSLSENESYFFAELKRLKYVVNQVESNEYFIILDEILKGTNSKDKAEGSEKFLRRLSKSKSSGIIATHDLSLCKVADDIPSVHNRFFDAQIIDDELYFDYKLKDGVCSNMNASFLMNKMDIV